MHRTRRMHVRRVTPFLDRVEGQREVLVVTRRGHDDVALVPADELSSLLETAYLLQSPANARRLLEALRESLNYEGPPPRSRTSGESSASDAPGTPEPRPARRFAAVLEG